MCLGTELCDSEGKANIAHIDEFSQVFPKSKIFLRYREHQMLTCIYHSKVSSLTSLNDLTIWRFFEAFSTSLFRLAERYHMSELLLFLQTEWRVLFNAAFH